MKTALLLTALVVSIAAGCAWSPAHRLVEVATSQTQVASTNGITATDAERVFRDVAERLGFVVKGPTRVTNTQLEFSARDLRKKPENPTHIHLMVYEKETLFISSLYGTRADFQAAEEVAALFQQELDKRGIHYTVTKRKSSFWAP